MDVTGQINGMSCYKSCSWKNTNKIICNFESQWEHLIKVNIEDLLIL